MPWVYKVDLKNAVRPEEVQQDWEKQTTGNAIIDNSHGGVSVLGTRCIIVSQRNNPDFKQMENILYVENITEYKEIPSRGTEAFDPPVELGFGIELAE